MKIDTHNDKSLYQSLAFLIPFIIYLLFPLNIHTWESYLYSDIIDNLQDLKDIFIFQNHKLEDYLINSNINLFHPNHPLPHLMTRAIYKMMGGALFDSLKIAQLINSIAGAIGVLYMFKILKNLSFKNLDALLGSLILGFSHLYWYQSISGEVYSIATTLGLIIFEKISQKTEGELDYQSKRSLPFLIGLAFISHMLSFFYLPAIFFMGHTNTTSFLISFIKRNYFIIISLICFTFLFYVAPHLSTTNHQSKNYFLYVIGAYTKIFGFWNNSDSNLNIFTTIATSIRHLSKAFLAGENIIFESINYIIILFTIFTGIKIVIRKEKSKMAMGCVIILVTYYLLIAFIINLPKVNDYWIFMTPYILILIFVKLKDFVYSRTIFTFLFFLFFSANLILAIYPQNNLGEKSYWVAKQVQIPNNSHIALLSAHPYSHQFAKQAWHLARSNRNAHIVMDMRNNNQMQSLKKNLNDNSYVFTDLNKPELDLFLRKNITSHPFEVQFIKEYEIKESGQIQNTAIGFGIEKKDWTLNQFKIVSIHK